jgi:hypothetical protein
MPFTQANHLLPFEIYLFTMLLEQHKEISRLRGMVDGLKGKCGQASRKSREKTSIHGDVKVSRTQ